MWCAKEGRGWGMLTFLEGGGVTGRWKLDKNMVEILGIYKPESQNFLDQGLRKP